MIQTAPPCKAALCNVAGSNGGLATGILLMIMKKFKDKVSLQKYVELLASSIDTRRIPLGGQILRQQLTITGTISNECYFRAL